MSYNAYNLSALARSQSGIHPHLPSIVVPLIFTMPETQSELTRRKFQTHLCPGLEPHPPHSLSDSRSDDRVTARVPKDW